MEANFKYITEQYEAVQESREVLFGYCKIISPSDFIREISSFGRGGSIRNLLVHIANVYEFWIANIALKKNISYTRYEANQAISDVVALFHQVDRFVKEFMTAFESPEAEQISYEVNGSQASVSRLKLFTHTITHEFHHKGQVLSLSRHLGYVPVDTDIIR